MSQTQLRVRVLGAHKTHEMFAGERQRTLTADTLQPRAASHNIRERIQNDRRTSHERDALDGAEFEPGFTEVFPAREFVSGTAEEHEGAETRPRSDQLVQEDIVDKPAVK